MKKREGRINKNIRIMLKDGEESYSGKITNFSKTGMSIKTDRVFPTYKVIDICVKIGRKIVPIKASVRWVNEFPADSKEHQKEMGVLLQNPPPEYLEYFD
jgi:Tfp pilus assembly protein PilZ